MASILTLALGLPVGAGIGHLLEHRQCCRSSQDDSIGSFLWRRIHGYAIMTWSGFFVFLYLLWTGSDGMAFVDPHAAAPVHSMIEGLLLGCLSGILLGCGLMGSVLNYQQIRAGDTQIQNSDLAVQLITDDEELV
jgi:hypothetical protein